MYNITIGRFEADPEAQGVVRPADDSWQLVIDKDGFPHLYVRVKLEGDDATGLLAIDDVLPEDLTIRDLMEGRFGGALPEGELEAAMAWHQERRAKSPIPCPR